MREEPSFIGSQELTADTDVEPRLPVKTSEMRIAPLGPDPTESLNVIPKHLRRAARPVVAPQKEPGQRTQKQVPLQRKLWIPITTTTVAIAAAITVFALLFRGAALSSPTNSPASMPPHGDSP